MNPELKLCLNIYENIYSHQVSQSQIQSECVSIQSRIGECVADWDWGELI